MTKEEIISKLSNKNVIAEIQKYNIKHIWLSGSFARWENNNESDIDIIYEADYTNFDSNRNRWPIWAYIYIENLLNKKVDIMSKTGIKYWAKESLLSDMQYIW